MYSEVWDDQLARVAQKWADQCADVDYKGDYKRRDPSLFHDSHPNRKIGRNINHRNYSELLRIKPIFCNLRDNQIRSCKAVAVRCNLTQSKLAAAKMRTTAI